MHFECCGAHGPDDWERKNLKVPSSCCMDLRCRNETSINQNGCIDTRKNNILKLSIKYCVFFIKLKKSLLHTLELTRVS